MKFKILNPRIVKADLEDMEWEEDYNDPDRQRRAIFLGTVMSLTPSGKFYTPFANSNVEYCGKCPGEGESEDGDCYDCECPPATEFSETEPEGCKSLQHCEVCRDADWQSRLEAEADELGLSVESGEDPCDILLVEYRDTPAPDEDDPMGEDTRRT